MINFLTLSILYTLMAAHYVWTPFSFANNNEEDSKNIELALCQKIGIAFFSNYHFIFESYEFLF